MDMKHTAIITIHDAPGLSKKDRKEIAEWLRHQAMIVMKISDKLAKRYTARYYITKSK
jgi:hypothetical protein